MKLRISERFKRRVESVIPNINWTAIEDYSSLVGVGIPKCRGCKVHTSLRDGEYCCGVCRGKHE